MSTEKVGPAIAAEVEARRPEFNPAQLCPKCSQSVHRDAGQDHADLIGYRCSKHGAFCIGPHGAASWPQNWRMMTEAALRERDYRQQDDILHTLRQIAETLASIEDALVALSEQDEGHAGCVCGCNACCPCATCEVDRVTDGQWHGWETQTYPGPPKATDFCTCPRCQDLRASEQV
jgi:hypothetical protein